MLTKLVPCQVGMDRGYSMLTYSEPESGEPGLDMVLNWKAYSRAKFRGVYDASSVGRDGRVREYASTITDWYMIKGHQLGWLSGSRRSVGFELCEVSCRILCMGHN